MTFLFVGFPCAYVLRHFTYNALLLLDMSKGIAKLGQQWASVAVVAGVLNGINEAFFQLANVLDTDFYSNVLYTMMSAVQTFSITIVLMTNPNASLVDVAFVKLGGVVRFIVINIIFLTMKGWMDLCWDGMVNSLAVKVSMVA